MTHEQAKSNITFFYDTYVSRYPYSLINALEMYDVHTINGGLTVDQAYSAIINAAFYDAAYFDNAFPGYAPQWNEPFDGNSIPSHMVVDYFYPNSGAQERAELIKQFDSGNINNVDFVHGWSIVAPKDSAPSVSEIIAVIEEVTSVPEANLSFQGVSAAQIEMLVGAYVAAFGRAPEHDGLEYWASELAKSGNIREIGVRFYEGGAGHGEEGTNMSNADYAKYSYENVLGRAPEKAGLDYWTGRLDDGLPRGEMIVEFVNAAQNGDREYLDARIAVSKFIAQEHVSGGTTQSSDYFVKAIADIENAADARAAIQDIIEEFGTGSSKMSFAQVQSFTLDIDSYADDIDFGFASVESFVYAGDDVVTGADDVYLVGVASQGVGAELA